MKNKPIWVVYERHCTYPIASFTVKYQCQDFLDENYKTLKDVGVVRYLDGLKGYKVVTVEFKK